MENIKEKEVLKFYQKSKKELSISLIIYLLVG